MDPTGLSTGSPYLAGGSSYRQWLEALANITRAVNDDRSEREVGDLIARTCTQLVGVDRAVVLVADHDRNALRAVGAAGLSPDFLEHVNGGPGIQIFPEDSGFDVAPSSKVFRERRAISLPDVRNSTIFAPWREWAESEGFSAMFAVPLVTGNEALGTIAFYNDSVGHLTSPQRELSELIADHAALALQSFQLRRGQAQSIDELSRTLAMLSRRQELHTTLTELALQGGTVRDIVAAVQAELGFPISLSEETEPSANTVRLPLEGTQFSSLYVEHPLDDESRVALEAAGLVVALEMQRAQSLEEASDQHMSDLLNEILTTDRVTDLEGLADRALRFGYRLDVPSRLVALRADDPTPTSARRIAQIARSIAPEARPQMIASYGTDITVVLVPDTPDHAAIPQTLYSVLKRRFGSSSVSAVVGPVCKGPAQLASNFRTLKSALRIRQTRELYGTMAYLGDLGTLQVLLPGVSDEAIEFSQRLLMPLQEQSHRASDALIPTLRCYLANGRSTSRAAKVLEVHPNTVNNRLERIAQLTNGSLDDTDHLLDLRLALLIQEILSCGSTNPAPHKEKERHDTSIDRQPRKRPA